MSTTTMPVRNRSILKNSLLVIGFLSIAIAVVVGFGSSIFKSANSITTTVKLSPRAGVAYEGCKVVSKDVATDSEQLPTVTFSGCQNVNMTEQYASEETYKTMQVGKTYTVTLGIVTNTGGFRRSGIGYVEQVTEE